MIIKVSGVSVQVSVQPSAKKSAGLIEKDFQHDKCPKSIDPPKADRIKEFFLFYLL